MAVSEIDEVLAAVDDWPVDNAAVAVLADGDVTVHGDRDRMFELASVSKLITALSALVSVEEGAFGLDDTVSDVCTEYGTTVDGPADATVRELLSHASGVGMQSRDRERPARDRRIYSSAGFEILADLISATGIPFDDYTREAVCVPLGISGEDLDLSGSPGHGFSATLGALITLSGEFLRPTVISSRTWDDALSPQFPDLDGIVPGYGRQSPCPWGLGFEIHGTKQPHWLSASMPEDVAGHFGQSGTFLWIHRSTGRAAVALTDRAFGSWAKDLWSDFNDGLWKTLS